VGRISWIKLYTIIVNGSTPKELLPADRWAWIDLLAMVGAARSPEALSRKAFRIQRLKALMTE